MSQSVRITKASLKASKTCHDGLLLGLTEARDLCRNCRTYFDLPVKKKPQSDMGNRYYGCLLKQEDGLSLPPVVNNDMDSERKRKAVYCQVVSTPAQTRCVLPFASSGRSSIESSVKTTRTHYIEKTRAQYSNLVREKEEDKSRLQEELERTQEELVRVKEKCSQLERDNTRLENHKRRSNECKQNDTKIYRSSDPFVASQLFVKELSANDEIEDAEVVAGVVRALAKKKFKKTFIASSGSRLT
jgi:hypothetical protein